MPRPDDDSRDFDVLPDADVAPDGGRTRRRYRRRHLVVLAVIAALLLSAGVYSVGIITFGWPSPLDNWSNQKPSCDSTAVKAAPLPVDIRVFNASGRRGLATDTSRKLKKRGFAIVQIANDADGPRRGKQVRIRYTKNHMAQARTLAAQFAGVDMKKVRGDDPVVDVVLGKQFRSLRRAKVAAARLKNPAPLPCNTPTPSATPTATATPSGG